MKYRVISIGPSGNRIHDLIVLRSQPNAIERFFGWKSERVVFYGHSSRWRRIDGWRVNASFAKSLRQFWESGDFEGEIAVVNSRLGIWRRAEVKTVFKDLLIALFVIGIAVPATIVGYTILEAAVPIVVGILFFALVVAGVFAYVLIRFGDRILKHVYKNAETQLEQMVDPLSKAATALIEKRQTDAVENARAFLRIGIARYAQMRLAGFTIAAFVSLVVAIAGFASSALLFRQNRLFEQQTARLDSQNILITAQNDLLTNQNDLVKGQNTLFTTQNELFSLQNNLVSTQNALTEANRRATLIFELTSILDRIDGFIKDSQMKSPGTTHRLPSHIEARLAALSRSFKPYQYAGDDGKLIERPLSPERGQLLITLLASPIQKRYVFATSTFARADLPRASLSTFQLSGADLTEADLRGTEFRYADLRPSVDVEAATTTFKGSNLQGAILRGAVFVHAKLGGADFRSADLGGVDFSFADFRAAGSLEVVFEQGRPKVVPLNSMHADLPTRHKRPTQLDDAICDDKTDFYGALIPERDWLKTCGAKNVAVRDWGIKVIELNDPATGTDHTLFQVLPTTEIND